MPSDAATTPQIRSIKIIAEIIRIIVLFAELIDSKSSFSERFIFNAFNQVKIT